MSEGDVVMAQASIYDRILDPASRANPFPLYAELRRTPVTREDDGTYVVSSYRAIVALLHDPRVSSDLRIRAELAGTPSASEDGAPGPPLPFINQDPPDHDRLRSLAMRQFGPPHTPRRIDGMRPWLTEVSTELIDNLAGKNRVDIVEDFAYPLPVTAICRLLGVPREDEPRFGQWADAIIETVDPTTGTFEERTRRRAEVQAELGQYLNRLVEARAD